MGIPGVLRPRTNSELFDAAFAASRRFAGDLLPLSLAFGLPMILIGWFLTHSWAHPGSGPASSRGGFFSLWLIYPLDAVRGWLLEAAIVEGLTTGKVDWAAARRRVGGALWPLVWRTMVFWFVSFIATLAFVFPGVLYYLHRRLYAEVLIVEGQGERSPFRRSFALTDGVLGSIALAILGYGLLQGAMAWSVALWGQQPLGALFNCLVTSFIAVVQAGFYVLLYYNRRAQREGLDLADRETAFQLRGAIAGAM